MNNHRLQKNIFLDYINTFITNLNMQSCIWVLYLAFCGLNLMQIGLLEGIYHATSIICEIPSGAMADLLGRKKSMVISRIFIAVSCVIMLFSKSFWLFALSFVIQAMGNNFNSGSEEALVYDSMKYLGREEEYIRVSGRINVLIEVSQAIATVLGGVLAEYSYVWCYATCVIIAILTLVPVLMMVEPPIKQDTKKSEKQSAMQVVAHHFKTSFSILKNDTRIFKIIVYYSVIFASYTMLYFYSQQYYSDFGYSKIEISVIFLFSGAVSCLGALHSEKIFKRFGTKISIVSSAVIALTFVCYGFSTPIVSILAFFGACYFNSILYPVKSNILNHLIPSEQRATLISVDSMFFSVAMIIMFPVVGAVADQVGLSQVFIILGACLLVVAVIGGCKMKNVGARGKDI